MFRAMCVFIALAAVDVQAGHGLMNAFGDVEWLPDPGYTPDQFGYAFDKLSEQAKLQFTGADQALDVALSLAREKLAEVSAMINAEDSAAAETALRIYRHYMRHAKTLMEKDPGERDARRVAYRQALFEHIYIMSVEYLDMPLHIRETVLTPFFSAAKTELDATLDQLEEAARAPLFFKEEQLRWTLEMVRQADVKGITN